MLDMVRGLLPHGTTERKHAAAEFVTLVGPALLPKLLLVLQDQGYDGRPDHGIRAALEFVQAGGQIAATESAPVVAKLLEHRDHHVRKHACDVLVEWGPNASTALTVYRQLFQADDQDTRERATYVSIFLGSQACSLEVDACSLLRDSSPQVRKSCLEILDNVPEVCDTTCCAIAQMLGDEVAEVRSFADYVLVQTNNPQRGLPVMIDLLERAVSTDCRCECDTVPHEGANCEDSVKALILDNLSITMDCDNAEAKRIVPLVLKLLDDRCPYVQEAAEDLMRKLGLKLAIFGAECGRKPVSQ